MPWVETGAFLLFPHGRQRQEALRNVRAKTDQRLSPSPSPPRLLSQPVAGGSPASPASPAFGVLCRYNTGLSPKGWYRSGPAVSRCHLSGGCEASASGPLCLLSPLAISSGLKPPNEKEKKKGTGSEVYPTRTPDPDSPSVETWDMALKDMEGRTATR